MAKAKGDYPGRYRNGHLLCRRTSKRTGKPCGAYALKGRQVCRAHGGKSPRGAQSPSFKSGRYSKHIPDRLLEKYETALGDERLLELGEDIALLDVRLRELVENVDTSGQAGDWKTMQELWLLYLGEPGGVRQAELSEFIESCIEEGNRWDEIRETLERRRRLVESERKRHAELDQNITIQEGIGLVKLFFELVKQHVSDAGALQAIGEGLNTLLAGGGDRGR